MQVDELDVKFWLRRLVAKNLLNYFSKNGLGVCFSRGHTSSKMDRI